VRKRAKNRVGNRMRKRMDDGMENRMKDTMKNEIKDTINSMMFEKESVTERTEIRHMKYIERMQGV